MLLALDTDLSPTDQNHIIFNVYYKKLKLQFRIEIGVESSNFASEVIRSKEGKNWLHNWDGFYFFYSFSDTNRTEFPVVGQIRRTEFGPRKRRLKHGRTGERKNN